MFIILCEEFILPHIANSFKLVEVLLIKILIIYLTINTNTANINLILLLFIEGLFVIINICNALLIALYDINSVIIHC